MTKDDEGVAKATVELNQEGQIISITLINHGAWWDGKFWQPYSPADKITVIEKSNDDS